MSIQPPKIPAAASERFGYAIGKKADANASSTRGRQKQRHAGAQPLACVRRVRSGRRESPDEDEEEKKARDIERQDDAGPIVRKQTGGRQPQNGRRDGPEEKTQDDSTLHGVLPGNSVMVR